MTDSDIQHAIADAQIPLFQQLAAVTRRLDNIHIDGRYVDGHGDQGIRVNVPEPQRGVPGINGLDGTNGTNGADSTVPGPKGDDGTTGATGPAITLTIGSVTVGAADATITGGPIDYVLNLVIPKGDKGDPGTPAIGTGTMSINYLDCASACQTITVVVP